MKIVLVGGGAPDSAPPEPGGEPVDVQTFVRSPWEIAFALHAAPAEPSPEPTYRLNQPDEWVRALSVSADGEIRLDRETLEALGNPQGRTLYLHRDARGVHHLLTDDQFGALGSDE